MQAVDGKQEINLEWPNRRLTLAQQWELGQLGQGKGVARGNPGLIIQSLDDYK